MINLAELLKAIITIYGFMTPIIIPIMLPYSLGFSTWMFRLLLEDSFSENVFFGNSLKDKVMTLSSAVIVNHLALHFQSNIIEFGESQGIFGESASYQHIGPAHILIMAVVPTMIWVCK